MLRKPGSQYQKVCLYRDGCNMFVYGDYGQFAFDNMTWTGSVYNLQYDNIGYQMEKLNHESRESLRVFDESKCEEDIYDWLKEHLEDLYDLDDKIIQKIINFFKESTYIHDSHIDKLCTENDINEVKDILYFTKRALENSDEYDWIVFLRNSNLEDFDDPCESYLWNAGKCIHQRYFICMYALQVCGEKLSKNKEN
ncbi:hypothetical protein [Thomasclavelia cocleata]|jgi:hypothetical protein|uniref:hypothetical protein n=1 Tax=Thomasclavelia cocleata TaxID=69824 RepID=UPI00255A8D10|nr:hypothetical protein [Thomasclavelia cocleata]